MSKSIYVASRASNPERPKMWRHWRDEHRVPIISTWIDEAGEGETADLSELWQRIEREVKSAAGLVLYVDRGDLPLKGAYVEAGIALAVGLPVYVVSYEIDLSGSRGSLIGSWIRHPLVRIVPSLQDAFDAILSTPSSSSPPATDRGMALARSYEGILQQLCEADDPIALLADWCAQAGLPAPKAASASPPATATDRERLMKAACDAFYQYPDTWESRTSGCLSGPGERATWARVVDAVLSASPPATAAESVTLRLTRDEAGALVLCASNGIEITSDQEAAAVLGSSQRLAGCVSAMDKIRAALTAAGQAAPGRDLTQAVIQAARDEVSEAEEACPRGHIADADALAEYENCQKAQSAGEYCPSCPNLYVSRIKRGLEALDAAGQAAPAASSVAQSETTQMPEPKWVVTGGRHDLFIDHRLIATLAHRSDGWWIQSSLLNRQVGPAETWRSARRVAERELLPLIGRAAPAAAGEEEFKAAVRLIAETPTAHETPGAFDDGTDALIFAARDWWREYGNMTGGVSDAG